MATDTARVQLELASGRNEITAPFHQTAPRRRNLNETSLGAPVDRPAAAAFVVDVPTERPATVLDAPAPKSEFAAEERSNGTARPPWLAFGAALIAVAVGVWWVMSQRMPAIDPAEVIERNLHDAQTAVADGRYTDPPERSAFHYYSTVLALDPHNADAISGVDAIADRHLTDARALLAQRRIAEAGVALEKARRVRPDHNGLAVLDLQWSAELRKLLADATVKAKPTDESTGKSTVTKQLSASLAEPIASPAIEKAVPQTTGATPDVNVKKEAIAEPAAENLTQLAALLAVDQPPKQPESVPLPAAAPAEKAPLKNIVEDNAGAAIAPEPATVASSPAAAAPSATEPKLIKMVQPQYPQEAVIRGIEGWVDVSLQVSATGDVIDPRVEATSRGRLFNRAALTAVEQWKYEPRNAGSTSERVRVRLQFRQSR